MIPEPLDPMQQRVSDERHTLLAFLDDSRDETVRSVAGMDEDQARRRLVPSLTTPLSVLKHLVFVERNWFHVVIQGRTRAEVGTFEDAEESWVLTDDDTVAGLLAEFRQVCGEAREIMADRDLDEVVVHRRMGEVTLRFIVVHVIREHSRHAGHVDILREQVEARA